MHTPEIIAHDAAKRARVQRTQGASSAKQRRVELEGAGSVGRRHPPEAVIRIEAGVYPASRQAREPVSSAGV
jgi:hypothetical protein